MRVLEREKTVEQQVNLLRLLREHGRQTRRQLAHHSGYSLSLVRQLTQDLADSGYITAQGIAPFDGAGRPSQLWSITPESCYAVGLDVGGTTTRLTVLDAVGQVVFSQSTPTLQASSSLALLDNLARLVADALESLGSRRAQVRGLGVAFSAFVDFRRGQSLQAPNIAHAEALPLQEHLAAALGLPVLVDDSSRTMAIAEMRYGAARQSEAFLCVNVGAGIGSGIVIGGQLYRGPHGLAGEIGHIPLLLNGPRCRCGGSGCLETLASGSAIAARARYLLEHRTVSRMSELCDNDPAKVTTRIVTTAAQQGDELALSLLEEAGTWLGMGIATAVNLYSPDLVVLTGGVMRRNTLLLSIVQRQVDRYSLTQLPRPFPVVLTELDEMQGALGAATLILDMEYETGFAQRLAQMSAASP
jgi:glucokinase-like ROK family protein